MSGFPYLKFNENKTEHWMSSSPFPFLCTPLLSTHQDDHFHEPFATHAECLFRKFFSKKLIPFFIIWLVFYEFYERLYWLLKL